jgi:hypothetical protein
VCVCVGGRRGGGKGGRWQVRRVLNGEVDRDQQPGVLCWLGCTLHHTWTHMNTAGCLFMPAPHPPSGP